ncbi:YolD-like family protein [Paenibacillus sp. KN14-4R]|uniref:YolD-like family protein n=1 Tax=Paenibacillus sp. KN14-4R TaxID=3445773 RepID=UPI003FA0BBDE
MSAYGCFFYLYRTIVRDIIVASELKGCGYGQHNGLWESSRMIIPQHKSMMLDYARDKQRKTKSEFDEQGLQEINYAINQSLQYRHPVELSLYDSFEDLKVIGVVVKVDIHAKRIRVDGDGLILV